MRSDGGEEELPSALPPLSLASRLSLRPVVLVEAVTGFSLGMGSMAAVGPLVRARFSRHIGCPLTRASENFLPGGSAVSSLPRLTRPSCTPPLARSRLTAGAMLLRPSLDAGAGAGPGTALMRDRPARLGAALCRARLTLCRTRPPSVLGGLGVSGSAVTERCASSNASLSSSSGLASSSAGRKRSTVSTRPPSALAPPSARSASS
mmetsp:Transcript_16671/g.42769  ORF Transcript_16671/g.42769 Transcript_16671/m.42769 type:complete len:206 (+) Transcript_16671:484-1101(+)